MSGPAPAVLTCGSPEVGNVGNMVGTTSALGLEGGSGLGMRVSPLAVLLRGVCDPPIYCLLQTVL
jgi:hypothetical protein